MENNIYYRDADFKLRTKEDFQRVLDNSTNNKSFNNAYERRNDIGKKLDYW